MPKWVAIEDYLSSEGEGYKVEISIGPWLS